MIHQDRWALILKSHLPNHSMEQKKPLSHDSGVVFDQSFSHGVQSPVTHHAQTLSIPSVQVTHRPIVHDLGAKSNQRPLNPILRPTFNKPSQGSVTLLKPDYEITLNIPNSINHHSKSKLVTSAPHPGSLENVIKFDISKTLFRQPNVLVDQPSFRPSDINAMEVASNNLKIDLSETLFRSSIHPSGKDH